MSDDLGLELKQVEAVAHKGQLVSGEKVEGRGVSVRFAKLRVTRLAFRRGPDALAHAVYLTRAGKTWSLASMRGRQTVLLQGPDLADAKLAGRALAAAWSVGALPRPQTPACDALKLAYPADKEQDSQVAFSSITLLGRSKTFAHDDARQLLEAARARAAEEPVEGETPARIEFPRPNHCVYRLEREGGGAYSEVVVEPHGAITAVSETEERAKVGARHLRTVLEGQPRLKGAPAERRKRMLGLLHTALNR